MEENVTETPPTTPYELREAVRSELADFVHVEGIGESLESDAYDLALQAQTAGILRDLAAALESLDRVCWANTPTQPDTTVTAPFDLDAAAVQLWNATQDAGASTAVGDAVVAELRKVVG